MRWFVAVLGWLLLVPAVQAQDAAQKLFEAMEQKLAKTKAHKIVFEIDTSDGGRETQLKGTLIFATGNRVKLTFEGQSAKKSVKGIITCDGKTVDLDAEEDGKPQKESRPAPDKLYENMSAWLIRASLFQGVVRGIAINNPIGPGKLPPTDFKMIGKEKVGGRDALVIEYRLAPPDGKDSATCKVWFDAQTNLPLKRVLEAGGGKFRVAETYTQWELDPKLPDGTFTMPK
jgi:outer membrane lipoprotein-sorting protein